MSFLAPTTCGISEFQCGNNQCIYYSLFCNGVADCADKSDELGCDICHPTTEIFCPLNRSCVSIRSRCDGNIDCLGGTDEMDCSPPPDQTNFTICSEKEFACSAFDCIPLVSCNNPFLPNILQYLSLEIRL